MPPMPREMLGVTLMALAVVQAAEAQTVRGTFADGETGKPIAGAVVVLLDEAGERVAGDITSSDGRFILRAWEAGEYRLEARMIGYETVSTGPFTLASGTVVHQVLETSADAIDLDGITAEVDPRCRPRPDATRDGQRLWELAKTTLAAVVLTDGAARIRLLARTFERVTDPTSHRVVWERVDTASAVRLQPFYSEPIEDLLANGFVRQVGDTTVYYGPDAEATLSEAFLSTHCFWAVAPGDGRVGLAFEPIPERRGLSEIEGTLWLDIETAALESLEFEYLHMRSDAGPYDYGGEVVFERLDNGAWIVDRWLLRLPQAITKLSRFGTRSVGAGLYEAGGEVLEVEGMGTYSLIGTPSGAVRGRLVAESGLPIPDALVYLSGTQHADSTDADGRFRLAGVREGDHSLVWFHAGLARTITPDLVDVRVVSNETTTATLTIAGFGRWPADGCAAAERREGTGVVFGMVREAEEGAPLRGAVLRLVPAVATSAASRADLAPVATASGASGEFRFCAVRPGEYRLEAERTDLAADSMPVIVAAGGLSRHAVELGREEF